MSLSDKTLSVMMQDIHPTQKEKSHDGKRRASLIRTSIVPETEEHQVPRESDQLYPYTHES